MEAQIAELEKQAAQVLEAKKSVRPRRPIVLEFCGSPKAGKTSCINSLVIFLKRNGFKVKVLTERASICPVPDKFDPFFNIWTTSSAIAELSEYLTVGAKDLDVIISDRGVFDGLCWFRWLRDSYHLGNLDYERLVAFLLMEQFLTSIDLVYVFTAEPGTSMDREYSTLLTRKNGSIMNDAVLRSYVDAIGLTVDEFRTQFEIVEVDTTAKTQNAVSREVTESVLERLMLVTEEQIGHLPRSRIRSKGSPVASIEELVEGDERLSYEARSTVEANQNLVQPLPIAVFWDPNEREALVYRKRQSSVSASSPERNKILAYAGGHIRQEDEIGDREQSWLAVAKRALSREIKEEIGLSYVFDNIEPFAIWADGSSTTQRHLAVCFVKEVDKSKFRIKLDRHEFLLSGRYTGEFMPVAKLAELPELEQWTVAIIEEVFDLKYTGTVKQLAISDDVGMEGTS